jgi:hypothetical protein
MDSRTTIPSLSVAEEEEIIDLVTSLPGSPTCSKDAEHAIGQKLSIDPGAAHPILENLLQKRRIEARTATATEGIVHKAEHPEQASHPPYKWFRPGARKSGDSSL